MQGRGLYRQWGIHGLRWVIFLTIIGLIHFDADQRRKESVRNEDSASNREQLQRQIDGYELGEALPKTDLLPMLDQNQTTAGYVGATSPVADEIVGFSGPTNVAVIFNSDLLVEDLHVLWSRDTKEHVAEVLDNQEFWEQFRGRSWKELAQLQNVDSVSGATLTSLAIGESIIRRFGGDVPSLKFPTPIALDDLTAVFENPAKFEDSAELIGGVDVYDANGNFLGTCISTSPAADQLVGYQGPTETLIALRPDKTIQRIHVRKSYDNQPYVSYLNEDWSWPEKFNDMTLSELVDFDLEENGIEGVSGATFTSMAVANAIKLRAQDALTPAAVNEKSSTPKFSLTGTDWGTFAIITLGLVISTTHLRGVVWLRVVFQIVLIGYLGFVNGDLLSQAMFVGWAQNGVPWRSSLRLVVLAGVAFSVPTLTKRNIYCSHLCPHGAAQQLLRRRLKFQWHPAGTIRRGLSLIPYCLLVWVVVVATLGLSFSLVDIEPFDAYLLGIAGWAAIGIAVAGIVASLFVPMAYCRFGCPTGTLLEYLRRNARSDQFSFTDLGAVVLLALAIALTFGR